MIANLARKSNSITSDIYSESDSQTNINIYRSPSPSSETVSLSYCSYLKKQKKSSCDFSRISTPRHASTAVASKDHHQFEYARNGSYVRIAEDRIDPYVTSPIDFANRQQRSVIKGFSKASQRRFKTFVSKIDQAEVSPNEILFITLTAPSEHWRQVTWKEWKKRLNNFNTQLRQKFLKTDMCGIWKQEFQERGAFHVHIVLFKVRFLDHEWVAEKWNNICCKNMNMPPKAINDHRVVGTDVQLARDWRAVGSYFSKTLAYLAKDVVSVADPIMREKIKEFGRHWGYINKKNIDKLINMIKGDFQNDQQFHKMRRWTRKLANSKQRMKYDRIKKESDKMKIKKDKNGNPIKENGKVVKIRVADCNKHHLTSKKLNRIFNRKHTKISAFISESTFKRMLNLADVDIDQAVSDSKNRWEIEQEKRKSS